jgi:acetyl esterase/lipase
MIPASRVLLVGVFLFPTIASAQASIERNVIYGMYSGTALLMDVHYPATANGLGIILVPGSGWSADTAYGAEGIKDGEQPPIWVPPLTDAGYTVFVPNHRATPAFHYPDPVHDIQRAIRFVRHNASRFKVDHNRLGGAGGSSGGHLIALMGLMDGKGTDDTSDPVNRQSAKLQTLVLRAAPSDLSMQPVGAAVGALLQTPAPGPRTSKASMQWRLYQEASPISYVTSEDPPTLLLHGDADPVVPHRHAAALHAALQKVHVPSKLVIIPRGSHGPTFGLAAGAPRPTDWPDFMGEMVRWFDQHLKTTKPTH